MGRQFHASVKKVGGLLWDVEIYETRVALLASYRINGTRGMAGRLARKRMRQARRGYFERKAARENFTITEGQQT